MDMLSSRIRLAAAVAVAAPLALVPIGTAQAAEDAQVSVLHGIPGLTVDVYVNGDLTLDDFKPGDLAGPLALPADTYSVEITDKNDKKTVLLGPADVAVESGGNYTIVAYLDAKGDPAVKPFENDISTVAPGEARVTVRHVAAAPAVDVDTKWGGGRTFFSGEGLFLLRCSGTGDMLVSSYGAIERRVLAAGEELKIDTGHIVAFTEGINYKVEKVGGWKSTLLSGEGLVATFSGPGELWMQSRSPSDFVGWLIPQLPTQSN
jgi:uncharacterized protein (AIM24 family)